MAVKSVVNFIFPIKNIRLNAFTIPLEKMSNQERFKFIKFTVVLLLVGVILAYWCDMPVGFKCLYLTPSFMCCALGLIFTYRQGKNEREENINRKRGAAFFLLSVAYVFSMIYFKLLFSEIEGNDDDYIYNFIKWMIGSVLSILIGYHIIYSRNIAGKDQQGGPENFRGIMFVGLSIVSILLDHQHTPNDRFNLVFLLMFLCLMIIFMALSVGIVECRCVTYYYYLLEKEHTNTAEEVKI